MVILRRTRIHFLRALTQFHLKIAGDIILMDTWIPPEDFVHDCTEVFSSFARRLQEYNKNNWAPQFISTLNSISRISFGFSASNTDVLIEGFNVAQGMFSEACVANYIKYAHQTMEKEMKKYAPGICESMWKSFLARVRHAFK